MSSNPNNNITLEIDGRTILISSREVTIARGEKSHTFRRTATLRAIPEDKAYANIRQLAPVGARAVFDGERLICIVSGDVLEAVAKHIGLSSIPRPAGLYKSGPALEARKIVSGKYAAAERRYDYAGEYYHLLGLAKDAHAAWAEMFPGSALLETADEIEAEAAEVVNNYSDLDGSLSRGDIDRFNDEREAKRGLLREKASDLRTQAATMADVEVVK